MVYIAYNNYSGSCSGTLIGSRMILTARHCAFPTSEISLQHATDGVGANKVLTYDLASVAFQVETVGTKWLARPDMAVIGIKAQSPPAKKVIPIATGADLPAPDSATMNALAGREVEIIGYSANVNDGAMRRVGTVEITGAFGTYQQEGGGIGYGFDLRITDAQQAFCKGDSGGPVLWNGKLIGVLAAGTNKDPVTEKCTASGILRAAFIDVDVIAAADPDGDGVVEGVDNCPNVPNAMQINTDELTRYTGDACDPTVAVAPVAFFDRNDDLLSKPAGQTDWNQPQNWPKLGLQSRWDTSGEGFPGDGFLGLRTHSAQKSLYYRLTGYSGASGVGTTHNVRAEFCACHDRNLSSSGNPAPLSEAQCDFDCPTGGTIGSPDPDRGIGWRRLTWRLQRASGAVDACSQNSDGECAQPLGNAPQSFVRLYGSPASGCESGAEGCKLADYEAFWTAMGMGRTKRLAWDYQNETYPHRQNTTFDRSQTQRAWVRVRIYPEESFLFAGRRANGFELPTKELTHGQTSLVLLRPVYEMPRFRWRLPTMIHLWRHVDPTDHPAIAIIAPIHPDTELDDSLYWAQSGGPSRGQVLGRIDTAAMSLGEATGAQRASQAALPTVGGALAQDGPWLFSFGGVDVEGQAVASLAYGRLDTTLSWQSASAAQGALAAWRADKGLPNTAAEWELLCADLTGRNIATLESTPAMANARIVADLDKSRLLAIFGEDSAGSPLAVSWRHLDGNSLWLSMETPSYLRRRDVAVAVSADGKTLYFYGGLRSGESQAGLFAVPMDPELLVATAESSARLDGGSSGPGARRDARIAVDPHGRAVYLFGGEQDGVWRNDLWRYDLSTQSWALLDEGSSVEAPHEAPAGALLISPVDGTLHVVAGGASQNPNEQRALYSYRLGRWWVNP